MNKEIKLVKCGEANQKGNIQLTYKGGCRKELKIEDAYRCVGCGGWFHKECILKHFELEKEHDYGRQQERKEIIEKIEKIIICNKCEGEGEIFVPGVGKTMCPDCYGEKHCVDEYRGQQLKEIINLIKGDE